jgi:hypothetical protein
MLTAVGDDDVARNVWGTVQVLLELRQLGDERWKPGIREMST